MASQPGKPSNNTGGGTGNQGSGPPKDPPPIDPGTHVFKVETPELEGLEQKDKGKPHDSSKMKEK